MRALLAAKSVVPCAGRRPSKKVINDQAALLSEPVLGRLIDIDALDELRAWQKRPLNRLLLT